MNDSKKRAPGRWFKWWSSGAVRQPELSPSDLQVVAIGTALKRGIVQYQVLSLGSRVLNSGPDWSWWEPVYCAVVGPDQKFELGQVLKRLPGNAVPIDVFKQARRTAS